jgi:hypothetical protein
MRIEQARPMPLRRLSLDPLHMTLRRQPRLRPATQFGIRMAIMVGMIIFIVAFLWFERNSLRDSADGHISFSDVIYFAMISATTTGYGDIVPVTDRARLFDALVVTPIRVFFLLLLAGTAYTFIIKRTWNRWLMKLIQKNLRDHILIAGFGVSNDKALEELLKRGTPAKRAGADVVVNPLDFAGLLLATTHGGQHIADYLADLASRKGKVQLVEREVRPEEVGKPLKAVSDGLGLRIIRGGTAYGFWRPQVEKLEPGDTIMEIVPTAS